MMRRNKSELKETGSRAVANNVKTVQAKQNPDLPEQLQASMETSFGEDFSNVKIHKDSHQANQLNALAFTQGNDIHFARGQFNPNSKSGKQLVGHEFAHVHQQRQGKVAPTNQFQGMPVNDDQSLEAEADQQGKGAVQAKFSGRQQKFGQPAQTTAPVTGVKQFVFPAIAAALGASEWIAAGALGYSILSDVANAGTEDVKYSWEKVDGAYVPNGGNDIPAHKREHPNAARYEARQSVAVFVEDHIGRALGLKFRITYIYDTAGAIGNISLSIIDVYDHPGYGGHIDVSIIPRSLMGGNASFRFTVNITSDNSWFLPGTTGAVELILRGGDGDLSVSFDPNDYVQIEIS